mmetsp:Transcript_37377/g.60020  ORF Transcript_37377/g.60020 Transcript_37377/m.60020 type:complete len:122 (+) Transcript_37377:1450-1815(+)
MDESKQADGPSRSKEHRYLQKNEGKQQQQLPLKLGQEASPGTSQDAFVAQPEGSYMKGKVDEEIKRLRVVRVMLEKAKRVIFQLMERDSYNRFCTTDEGRQIMREIEALKLERKASEAGVA